ncbi:MAG: Fic family protein [Alphaproteobacteria bacterium]|nr:Fic family protein [Alphaproteobacteria bacterium]
MNVLQNFGNKQRVQLAFPLFLSTILGSKFGREEQEIQNMEALLAYVRKNPFHYQNITEKMLFKWHKILFQKNTWVEHVGCYRKRMSKMSHTRISMTPTQKVPQEMEALFLFLKEKNHLKFCAEFLYRFLIIHPFQDGNGRLGRFIANMILLQEGFPPFLIEPEDRPEYSRVTYKTQLMAQAKKPYPHEDFYIFILKQLNKFLSQSLNHLT